MKLRPPTIPPAPKSIQKGVPLKHLLDADAVDCLAQNVRYVHRGFKAAEFCASAMTDLDRLELMQRGQHIARCLHQFLPDRYADAIEIINASLTPAQTEVEDSGLAGFFYLPHGFFISDYGLDVDYNHGDDPFDLSMRAMYELTSRFTAEFAIRPFLIQQQDRTLARLHEWLDDPNPHVRRLCSEGTRPKLPWGKRIPSLIENPEPTLPILEALKDDESLYVRRSVANHLGDIAKDNQSFAFETCERWLQGGASAELKWLIRHALRHPAKKGDTRALEIRQAARAG